MENKTNKRSRFGFFFIWLQQFVEGMKYLNIKYTLTGEVYYDINVYADDKISHFSQSTRTADNILKNVTFAVRNVI